MRSLVNEIVGGCDGAKLPETIGIVGMNDGSNNVVRPRLRWPSGCGAFTSKAVRTGCRFVGSGIAQWLVFRRITYYHRTREPVTYDGAEELMTLLFLGLAVLLVVGELRRGSVVQKVVAGFLMIWPVYCAVMFVRFAVLTLLLSE